MGKSQDTKGQPYPDSGDWPHRGQDERPAHFPGGEDHSPADRPGHPVGDRFGANYGRERTYLGQSKVTPTGDDDDSQPRADDDAPLTNDADEQEKRRG